MASQNNEVERYLQGVGLIRIAYGVMALFTPRLLLRLLGLEPDNPDARAWNAFLGSRDIVLGIHSLVATKHGRQRDAVLLNSGCEVFDTIVVGQEIRLGRPFGIFNVAGVAFNATMHVLWFRARRLMRA
jgi:hypothetical protein